MTSEVSHLDQQREAREAAQTQEPPWNTNAARLLSAGWKEKVRMGRRIWASPESGYWFSEQMAYELLERGQK